MLCSVPNGIHIFNTPVFTITPRQLQPLRVRSTVLSVRNHDHLVRVLSIPHQDKILSNPLPCVLPGDAVPNSLGLPPGLGVLDANADLLGRLAVGQQARADDGVGFLACHQALFHDRLVLMRDLEQDMVQRNHSERDIAAEARKARGAASDDVRCPGGTATSELSESLKKGSRAFPADLWVVNAHPGQDEPAANGGNDHIDKFPVLALKALGYRSDIVGVSLNNLEVRGSICREDGRELRGGTAERDALVAGSEGMLKCREANAGARAKERNGLGVATHCGGLLIGRFSGEERRFSIGKRRLSAQDPYEGS